MRALTSKAFYFILIFNERAQMTSLRSHKKWSIRWI